MKCALALVVVSALSMMSCAAVGADGPNPPAKAAEANVPVKAVVLYSSGVGYFEHAGKVSGDGSTQLNFKAGQINDILKSLVLQDLDGGNVTSVTYPSQDPIEKTLKSFQVDVTGNPPMADLLNQLRGAKVRVNFLNEKIEGIVLGVEKRPLVILAGSPAVDCWIVNLLSGASIKSMELNKLTEVQLLDEKLQEELGKALAALAGARDQDKKPVSIQFAGQGDRRVRLGYVVETPVWKTSYRLILQSAKPDANADKAAPKPADKLQGWAIVENQTDNDWNDVSLSLVSGRPISFVQDLYQPLYIPRPVVQPELYASLRPQEYEGGRGGEKQAEAWGNLGGALEASRDGRIMAGKAKRMEAAKLMAPAPVATPVATSDFSEGPQFSLNAAASVQSIASSEKIGELFQYTVGNVSLPRQKSAMIPIITDDIEVEKLSIYNAGVLARNPLNGARLKNTTSKHLLAGPITVLEGSSYAGDARIDNLPPGQERLLSYGIDLQLTVDSTKVNQTNLLLTGKIVKGVLVLTRKYVSTQEYLADNKGDKDKSLIVEHPIKQGWKLVETDKPIETTAQLYRFKGVVTAGKASKLVVKEEMVNSETIAILSGDVGSISFYSRSGEIPQPVRDALAKVAAVKQALVDTQREVAARRTRINEITTEQNRIRENMRTVDASSQYYKRLLTKLNEQETALDKMQTEIDDLQKKADGQQKEMEAMLSDLTVG